MKILVIGDLHGKKPVIGFKDFDCIVQIGDVCDDRGFRPYLNKFINLLRQGKEVSGMDEFIISKVGKKGFNRIVSESLSRGHEILRYLDSFGKPVFFVPGNWDESYGKTKIKDMDKSSYNYLKAFFDFYLYVRNQDYKQYLYLLSRIYHCQQT